MIGCYKTVNKGEKKTSSTNITFCTLIRHNIRCVCFELFWSSRRGNPTYLVCMHSLQSPPADDHLRCKRVVLLHGIFFRI